MDKLINRENSSSSDVTFEFAKRVIVEIKYESILANYNQPVRVLAKEPYEGVARGITDGGELLVEKTDGTIVAVSAGEVSVRGLYSYV